jgi:hypothetical protein
MLEILRTNRIMRLATTAFVIGLVAAIFFGVIEKLEKSQSDINQEPVACTMDAKICADGSAVGRSGPNCEFAACPLE